VTREAVPPSVTQIVFSSTESLATTWLKHPGMPAALSFNIPIISSRLPGTTVSFTINPYIAFASRERARTGLTVMAPTYSRRFRSHVSRIHVLKGKT